MAKKSEKKSQQTQQPQDTATEQVVEVSELEKMTALAEDYKRKWYAVSAEYDNYRKRTATATAQAYADGKSETLIKLLPIADTFGYAYDGADEKTKAGIDKIIKNFNAILQTFGAEEIALSIGDTFSEDIAEAVLSVPCEEGEQPQTVKQIIKKGYRMGDKVVRFAQVIVTV